jgi:hypothetical protein
MCSVYVYLRSSVRMFYRCKIIIIKVLVLVFGIRGLCKRAFDLDLCWKNNNPVRIKRISNLTLYVTETARDGKSSCAKQNNLGMYNFISNTF